MQGKTKFIAITTIAISAIVAIAIFSSQQKPSFINMHEHLQNMKDVEPYLEMTKKLNIQKTLLLGSPKETLLSRGGFADYDKNNDELLKIKEKYPNNFEVLCTTYWHDADQIAKIASCYSRGAVGVKLYNGHSSFYELPLDDASMLPVYRYIEDNGLILLVHVNANNYLNEFENVLKKFPKMKVICPHFCLFSKKLGELEKLMDKYPNLYTDTSFGHIDFTVSGMKRMSQRKIEFANFIKKYPDRVFFGTDQVVTNIKTKSHMDFLEETFKAYLNILGEGDPDQSAADDTATFTLATTWPESYNETLESLFLDKETLKNILTDAPQKLLDSVPKFTQ